LHKVYFYRDKKGREPVLEYIRKLAGKKDKDSPIKLTKIQDYINTLMEYGTQVGEPYVKHLDGQIWELCPLKDRILFAGWVNGGYVLLHTFVKKTNKTPLREIEKAKKAYKDLIERSVTYE